MTLLRSVAYIFYGYIFENKELKQTLGYSFDIWLDEYLEQNCTKIMTEKEYWKEKAALKRRLGVEVIFYDGEEDINVGLAVKDSLMTTCSGLADIVNLDYFKVDKSWDPLLKSAYSLFIKGNEGPIPPVKGNWYIVTKPEI